MAQIASPKTKKKTWIRLTLTNDNADHFSISNFSAQPVNCVNSRERRATALDGSNCESLLRTAVASWDESSKETLTQNIGASRAERNSFTESFQRTMSICS